ncbi:hypothetical protein T484DRAFT_1742270 [Baffinella frigidus]|nr:hypothetical protein T484DRAFT_1742270 [Cryptophyta sp. CCMP2293]
MADTAFDDGWDMEAGQVLRGIAKLYEAEGVSDTAIGIREDIDRIIEDRDYPKNLEPRAPRPSYTIKDKWNVVIRGPAGVGEEAIEIVARPVQSAKLLIKAWLGSSEMDVDTIGDYELRVPEEATSWRVGLVDSELEIGMTGIMPDGEVQVLLKAPKEEDKEEVTATAVAEDSE